MTSAGESRRSHAAASTMPSGSPATRRQIANTCARLSSVSQKAGWPRCAACTKSCTALDSSASARLVRDPSGNPMPATAAVSPSTFRLARLVTSSLTPGAACTMSQAMAATLVLVSEQGVSAWESRCSQLSRISSSVLARR